MNESSKDQYFEEQWIFHCIKLVEVVIYMSQGSDLCFTEKMVPHETGKYRWFFIKIIFLNTILSSL